LIDDKHGKDQKQSKEKHFVEVSKEDAFLLFFLYSLFFLINLFFFIFFI